MLIAASPLPAVRQEKRLRRWAARGTAAGILLAAVAYVSLPVWLPTQWLAHQVITQLEASLHSRVHLGKVTVGWADGLAFHDLRVDNPAGASTPTLARVGQVRCSFEPLFTLLTGRVRQLDLIDPQLWLEFDEAGQITNLRDLGELEPGALPSLLYSVEGLRCALSGPGPAQVLTLDHLDCALDPATGVVRVLGRAARQGAAGTGRFSIDAKATVTRLKADRGLGGTVHADWSNLSINDLPSPLALRLPIRQVDGLSSGRLALTPHPDLSLDFDLRVSVAGVKLIPRGRSRPAVIPDANIHLDGHWDPSADVLVLRDLAYETPGLQVRRAEGAAVAVHLERPGDRPLAVALAGRVKNWAALGREVPQVETTLRTYGMSLTGAADFRVNIRRDRDGDALSLAVQARDSACLVEERGLAWLDAPAGLAKSVELEWQQRREEGLASPSLRLGIGGILLDARGECRVPWPPDSRIRWPELIASLDGRLQLSAEEVAEAVRICPALARVPLGDCRGPLQLALSSAQTETDCRLSGELLLPAKAALSIGRWFNKPAGRSLRVAASASLPQAGVGRFHGLEADIAFGPASLALGNDPVLDLVTTPSAGPDTSNTLSSVELSARLPIHVRGIESFLELFPACRDALAGHCTLAGDAELSLSTRLSYHPGDLLLGSELELIADDLAATWPGYVDKPAGLPLRLLAAQRWHRVNGRREGSASCELAAPGTQIRGGIALAPGRQGESSDFEQAWVTAECDDVARWRKLSAAARDVLERWHAAGQVRITAASLLLGGERVLEVSGDATAAAFEIPGYLAKPAGTPAEWHFELAGAVAHPESLEVRGGKAQLAGFELNDLSGRVGLPAPESAGLQARGRIRLDAETSALHPRINEWCRRYAAGGLAEYNVTLAAEPDAVSVSGRLDGRWMHAVWPRASGEPLAVKSAGQPAALSVDASISRAPSEETYRIQFRDTGAELDGNSLHLDGAGLVRADARGIEPLALDTILNLQLEHPAELAGLLPASAPAPLDGAASASARLHHAAGETSVSDGRLHLANLRLRTPGDPLQISGDIAFNDHAARSNGVRLAWGSTSGLLSGELARYSGGNRGRLALAIDRLDVTDLQARLAETAPSSRPAGDRTALVERLLTELGRTDLLLDAHVGTLQASLPLQVQVTMDSASGRAAARQGPLSLEFHFLVDGGTAVGTVEAHPELPDGTYHLAYRADRVQPGPLVDRYLALTFPGMKATGPLTLIDESVAKLRPQPGELNYPVGRGELIIDGGTIEGRATPLWMTRIFPGLNISRFEFSYMHSWFQKFADGRIRHQMIYQGRFYNVYMIGDGDAEHRINYEVGIDFFADFDSHYWAEVGQGRVPLFIKTGRMRPDGTLADEEVRYTPPQRILDTILVKNNPIFTAYHVVRKRVLSAK